MVETARGPMPVDDLGRVLAHEHVFVLSPEILQNYPEVWGDEDERVADAVQRLTELKQAGIDTIIDPTALGLGRYVPRVARIAQEIELNIVVATGLYTFDEVPTSSRAASRAPGPTAATPWSTCSSGTASRESPTPGSRRG